MCKITTVTKTAATITVEITSSNIGNEVTNADRNSQQMQHKDHQQRTMVTRWQEPTEIALNTSTTGSDEVQSGTVGVVLHGKWLLL